MITVSYKDFISNSGNIQLDKIEDKLRNLFLVDSKIKLKEVDKIYTIDNINDFKKMTCKALIGAVTLPLALLADNWARVGEKKMAKKWNGIAAITGAAIMCIAAELVGCTKQAKK